jgi:hypothetical protein
MGVLFVVGQNDGSAYHRAVVPATWLNLHGGRARVVVGRVDEAEGHLERMSTVVISRGWNAALLRVVPQLQARGLRVLYDFDDDYWSLPEWNPCRSVWSPDSQAIVEELLRRVDRVTVSTAPLAERARQFASDVVVVPNGIPREAIPPLGPRTRDGIRVGWSGSPTHVGDFMPMAAQLVRWVALNPKHRLVFLGWCPPGLEAMPQVEAYRAVPTPDYLRALRALELDAWVVPLTPNAFNAAKSDLKLREGAALGIPMAASAVGPYAEHGTIATLVPWGLEADWVHAITATVFRGPHLVKPATAWFEREVVMDVVGPQWAAALDETIIGRTP